MSESAARALTGARVDEIIGKMVRKTGRTREEVLAMPKEQIEVAVAIWKLDAQAAAQRQAQPEN